MIKNAFNIVKSKSDKRKYFYRQLPNKLKCLMIEDMEADKSSAAMNVNVGSLMDEGNFYGLAHFLEHMLFMGTEKYPSENDFMEFLNENSGHSNAYTDLDSTNYFFEVSNDSFVPAVDRFAQFFIKPLFNSSAVEREVKAVDSENKKNLQSDMWRFMQLIRSQGNPKSLFTRFATGNLETLNKPNIRDVLINYHNRYYSSNLMSLVMLAPKSIEEMNHITDDLFSKVPLNNSMNISPDSLRSKYSQVYPYEENNSGYFYKIIPVKDQDTLSLYWFINENLNEFYNVQPMGYLSSLLGHEGPNSLTSSLLKDDLITNLSCGAQTIANTYTYFALDIKLTKKGFINYSEVIGRIFNYLNKIKERGVNQRFFDEIQQIHKIKFDFKNKEHPTNYCSDLAHNFTVFPPEHVLSAPYLINSYDEKLIDKYLKKLEAKNLNIYLSSKTFQQEDCNLTEEWYKTNYCKTHFSEYENGKIYELIKNGLNTASKHVMDYPPENKFIPKNFDLLAMEEKFEKSPKKLFETQNTVLWYKKDNTFKLPKAIIVLQIYLNKKILSHENYDTIASIWNSIFENELKEMTYMASEANINFKLNFNLEGIHLEVSGFNSSLENAVSEILNNFKRLITNKNSIENLPEKINIQIEDHMKSYKNFYFSAAYTQAMAYLDMFLREPSTTPEKKIKFLGELEQWEDENKKSSSETNNASAINPLFDIFISKFLQESRFEWLIQGNITEEESLKIKNNCEEILLNKNLNEDDMSIYRIARISPNKNYYHIQPSIDPKNENSAIVSFFQVGNPSEKEKVSLYVIESLVREKFFDELRTKQTLGYIVRLAHKENRKVDGFVCVVQSNLKSPEDIHQRISKFLKDFQETFKNLTDEHFESHRNSVIIELKQKDLRLGEEVYRNFSEIKKRDYDFNRTEKQIELLATLKKEIVEKMFEEIFVVNPRRLDIEILADHHKMDNEVYEKENNSNFEKNGIARIKVNSVSEFKKSVELYPDFFSDYKPKF